LKAASAISFRSAGPTNLENLCRFR
jgi:hypothetical protein